MNSAAFFLDRLRDGESAIATRVALVVAHPDDETIGAGAQLRRMKRLVLTYLTDGAPRGLDDARKAGFSSAAEYAAARRSELAHALATGETVPESISRLGLLDQESARHIPEIVTRLCGILRDADIALTHPYEGGHPDHDTAALAVGAAAERVGIPVVEMAGYFARDGAMRVGEFLPSDTRVITLRLSDEARGRKRRMLDAFVSQHETLRPFRDDVECFRVAPAYDFTRPPHEGPLWYERFGWPVDGAEWRRLAREATVDGRWL